MDDEINMENIRLFKDTNMSSHPTTTKTLIPHIPKEPLLDANTEYISNILLYVALCVLIGAFGTVANIINIIVYVRMGIFNMASNLNLFSLAVSDLGVSVTTFLHGAGFAVIVMDIKDLPFDPFGVAYYVAGHPLLIFSMINRLLTAYVALERCLCVVLPFRIRTMFSIKRCVCYIITIYIYIILSQAPLFFVERLEFQRQPGTNISKLVLVYTAARKVVHPIVLYTNNFTATMATVAIVFVCTVVTSGRIKTSKAWRKSVSGFSSDRKPTQNQNDANRSSGQKNKSGSTKMSDDAIDREMRLVKMISTVSLIYLVCYIPDFLLLLLMGVTEDEISFKGPYYRLAQLIYGLALVASAFNSSVNILVYYRMSTRYRQEFLLLFRVGVGVGVGARSETKDESHK